MATKKTTITEKKEGKTTVRQKPSKPDYRTNIIVQFHDNVRLPYNADAAKYVKEYNVGPWDQLVSKHHGLTISPVFSGVDPDTLKKWIRKAKEMDPTYKEGNFFQYFKVTCPVESDPQTILKDLSGWTNVSGAYINKTFKSSIVDPAHDPRAGDQLYLNNSPNGISSLAVWGINPVSAGYPGSDGAGIKFIDIETGWTLEHEDLNLTSANLLGGGSIDDSTRTHGTSVLGIVGAKDNTDPLNEIGCIGIAPNSTVNVVTHYLDTVANAIIKSLSYLGFGDVLLIEATNTALYSGFSNRVPVETTDPEFDAIRLAVALGVIVIEPGGNGYDSGTPDNPDDDTPVWFNDLTVGSKEILNPGNTAHFRDSGAIIVSAARSSMSAEPGCTDSHMIMPGAPFGDRVDCGAWGENITTLSSDPAAATDLYVNNFGGTSGAAAIIAGAVLSMQGMLQAEHGHRFSPFQMRQILRNPAYGTPICRLTGDPFNPVEKNIFMPDLKKFATLCINSLPDLYLRDHVGDNGDPHTGPISCSPDIILKNDPLVSQTPQEAFGDGATVINDTAEIGAGYYSYLYARAYNRGGKPAAGAHVKLYYSIPATLVTPNLLSPVILLDNTLSPVTPNEFSFPGPISNDDQCNVTNEYAWSPVQIGTATHYCFVGLVGSTEDPAPDIQWLKSLTWAQYCQFIQNNNNVTWRNFNMVVMPPPPPLEPDPEPIPDPEPAPQPDPPEEEAPGQAPPADLPKKGWVHMDFISPGLPGIHKKMDIEIISKLPRNAIGILQAPLPWKREVFRGSPYVRTNVKRKKCYSHFNPAVKTKFEDIHFKADSKTPLRLYVNVPAKLRNINYTVAVRQILEGVEIGRVTYMLVPWKKKPKPQKPVKPVIKGKIIPGKK